MIIDPLLLPFEEFDEPDKRDIERAIEEQEEDAEELNQDFDEEE